MKIDELNLDEELQILREGIVNWWRERAFDFPWRDEDLPEWQKLVTEVLLQRTRATAVRAIYAEFFSRFSTVDELAAAGESEMREAIFSLGLLWRAKFLSQLAEELCRAGGAVPETREELLNLPGVGPYVSGAFLTLHRNEASSFVDANVVRLLGRYLGFSYDGETRRKKWFLAVVEALFSHPFPPKEFGYAILDFTREVCGKTPRCNECPASARCIFARARSVPTTNPGA